MSGLNSNKTSLSYSVTPSISLLILQFFCSIGLFNLSPLNAIAQAKSAVGAVGAVAEVGADQKITIEPSSTTLPQEQIERGAKLEQSPVPTAKSLGTSLQEVQVNAGRLESRQFDTPAATYLIDALSVANTGNQVNLSDALSLAPGVVSLNRNNYAQDIQISIRGYGARTTFGLRGIRLITDDIPATIPDGQGQASTVSLPSIDHIEVLSGPLAQLYGNSSGGVIQTYTKEAGPTFSGQVQSYFGSYGMQRSDWQVTDRLGAQSQVGVVADYSTFKINGWRQNSSAERVQFNNVITIDPQEDTRFKLVLNSFNMPLAQDPLGLTAAQLKANPQQAGLNAVLDLTQKTVKQDQVGLVMQQKLSNTLSFQARIYDGIRDTNQTQASSCDASVIPAPSACATTPAPKGTWIALQRNFNGVGLQLKGKEPSASLPWDWTFGVDYDRSSENRETGSTLYGGVSPASAVLQNVATNNDLFAQANFYLNDNWTLTAGARYDHVTITNTNFSTALNGGASSFINTNPVIGVTWHLFEQLNLYANTGLGFETPTTSETAYSLQSGSITPLFNAALKASESHNYELGSKWLASPTTQMNAAWFLINTSNDIITAQSLGGKTVYQNAAQTTREGLEFSLKDSTLNHFKEQLSFTYMKAQYGANSVTSTTTGSQNINGNALPGIPKESLYALLGWSERGYAQRGSRPNTGAEVELGLSARSNIWANDLNTTASSGNAYASGYGLIDLKVHERVQISTATLDAYLGVNNATNRSYVGSVIVNQANAGYFEPGLPRNWTVGLRFALPL